MCLPNRTRRKGLKRFKTVQNDAVSKEREEKGMATQIAATPILRGKEAKSVLREVRKTRGEKASANASKLAEFFSSFEKKK